MNMLKNVPEDPQQLASLIDYRPGCVVSRQLSCRDDIQITLFSFPEDEGVSGEAYPGDTLYYVIEGEMVMKKDGKRTVLSAGSMIAVPGGKVHALYAEKPFKLLQITFHTEN